MADAMKSSLEPLILDATHFTLLQLSEQVRANYAVNGITIVQNAPLSLADTLVGLLQEQLHLENWKHRPPLSPCKHLSPGNYEGQPLHLIVPHCEYPTHMHPEVGFFYGFEVDCNGGESVFSRVPTGDFGDMQCMGGTFVPKVVPPMSEKLLSTPPGERREMLTVSNQVTDFDESAYEALAAFLSSQDLLLDKCAVSTNRDRIVGLLLKENPGGRLFGGVSDDDSHGFGQRNFDGGAGKRFFEDLLASSVIHKLKEGELAIVPNKRWTHARNQFSGTRKLLVAFLHNRGLVPCWMKFLPYQLHYALANSFLKRAPSGATARSGTPRPRLVGECELLLPDDAHRRAAAVAEGDHQRVERRAARAMAAAQLAQSRHERGPGDVRDAPCVAAFDLDQL